MSTTSMSLETLQFLLRYMDANRRFEISNRCPALRAIDKSVPLKIKSLVFRENCVIVNETKYKIGVIRKYNIGEAPGYVTVINKRGGVPHEVDRYGIFDKMDALAVTSGDVELQSGRGREQWIENEDARVTRLENDIQFYEGQLAQQRVRRPNRNQTYFNRLEKTIEDIRAQLLVCQCRRDNIPPNFENFLQLTISREVDEQKQKTIQRYIHKKKYSEAMKQLTTVLFGDRSSPIYVKKFNITSSIIRLPVGVKFHVEQLIFYGSVEKTLEALTPVIHESSFPLKKFDINLLSVEDATNLHVRAAGTLSIIVLFPHNLQFITAITNPVVRIILMTLSEQTLEGLIGNWIELKRPIGTEHTILIQQEPWFADEMEDISKRFNGVPIDDENVAIPMSDDALLKISYGPFPEFAPHCSWAVKFLTEAIDH